MYVLIQDAQLDAIYQGRLTNTFTLMKLYHTCRIYSTCYQYRNLRIRSLIKNCGIIQDFTN